MIRILRKLLIDVIEKIDAGNTDLTEDDVIKIADTINQCALKDEGISKYSACRYLNISRATFDNLVKAGKLPEGKHILGFKEKRWYKKDLDKYVRRIRDGK